MGSGTIVELDQPSSGSHPDRGASTVSLRRVRSAIRRAFSRAGHIVTAKRKSSAAASTDKAAAKRRWDAALEDPEAHEFLERAMNRRKQMEEQGLIHRP